MAKKVPTPEIARAYVRISIFEKGGWREGIGGFFHKTLPFLLGLESSLSVKRVAGVLIKVLLVFAAAVYPLIVRKAFAFPGAVTVPSDSGRFADGIDALLLMVANPAPIDYALGFLAVIVTGLPKLIDGFSAQSTARQHSPYYDLAAAIKSMPQLSDGDGGDTDRAIQLTLCALKEEMSQLIGDDKKTRVTDITFLEFCDATGTAMQVRARTANHEEVRRPVASNKFVAYYVAREGRSFAEHDFLRTANPFPANRVTIVGSPRVGYRSVLYMPVICSEPAAKPVEPELALKALDSCIGVICVHSARPYRFWRWGDHRKGVGGFANVATDRALPYIALVKRLTERAAHKVILEAA